MANTTTASFNIGDISVTRVEEQCGVGFAPDFLFPDWTPEVLDAQRHWMVPTCFDEGAGRFIASVHSWLVRTPHHTILIDCCGGNDKERPGLERFHQQSHPYLARLRAAGVRPDQVDYVMCTHLHVDHCGWNTQLVDGRWVPTFPNAKYIFSKAEHDHWAGPAGQEGFNANVYQDSVLPVVAAGLVELIDGRGVIGDGLRIEPTPGHSAGHVAFVLAAQGQQGVFSGDILHQPLQVYYPDWNSRFCEHADDARRSRKWVLDHCADTGALLFPAHFAGSHAGRVHRHGERYTWEFG